MQVSGAVGKVVVNPGLTEREDFSLVLGGPLYQLLLRSRLIRPPFGNLGWRIGVITALAWLPLVPLTVLGGRFAGGVRVPFLYDFEAHSRLLFSLPLMVLAEVVVFMRMRGIAAQFLERHIITGDVRSDFDRVLSSVIRLRNSIAVELALLIFVILAGPFFWRGIIALRSDTWYASITGAGTEATPAGRWYAFVSVPIFQFVLLRWYYRIMIWCYFLFRMARLELNLVPLHPDRCCGLGFLGNVVFAFAPLLMAHTGIVTGFVANRILHEGASLPDFKFELLAVTVFLLVIALGPLCLFIPKLNAARLAGLRTYGRLASDYVVGFAGKWSRGAAPDSEPLLGSADIQSLADLDSSFAVVREMKIVPFGKETIVRFLVIIALPLTPLAFTMFSAEELVKRLITVLL
jgi:hypothetical protein